MNDSTKERTNELCTYSLETAIVSHLWFCRTINMGTMCVCVLHSQGAVTNRGDIGKPFAVGVLAEGHSWGQPGGYAVGFQRKDLAVGVRL